MGAESNQDASTGSDDDIGVKPYRCIIQELLCQGATNKEITDQVATFMMVVCFVLVYYSIKYSII